MLRSFSFLRAPNGLALLLPMALLGLACGGESGTGATGGSASTTSSTGGSSTTSGSVTGSGGAGGESGQGGAGGGTVSPDTTAPTVLSTFPLAGATGVAINGAITATFSEPMAPLTISATSFQVTQAGLAIPGVVTYLGDTATFLPTAALALGVSYTATITTLATDLAGNKLATSHVWAFATDAVAPKGPAPVLLGAANLYVILAQSAISSVPTSAITGDLGLSPAAASFITGFNLTRVGVKWTSAQVTGAVYSADSDAPTPSNLTQAIGAMQAAYSDAAGRPTPDMLNLGAGILGGLTIVPGLYKWTSSVTIPTDVTIAGAANDTWIFQVSGDLTVSAAKHVLLLGGAKASNIVWQVAGLVNLGTTSHTEGTILAKTSITLGTGASINGRLMAQTAVNLDSSVVKIPAP